MVMEILNGYGAIDTITGKYLVNVKDRIESKKIIRKFENEVSKILEEKFGSVFRNDAAPTSYCKFTEQSSAYLWTPSININTSNALTNRGAMVYINTGINSNGYNGKIVKRHFVVSFQLNAMIRPKYHKNWNEGTLLKTYILKDNYVDSFTEFKFWLNTKFDLFIQ
jgi:hypothetical protein